MKMTRDNGNGRKYSDGDKTHGIKSCQNDITWHHATVTRERRENMNGHRSFIVWFTGLSGAGKSTLAHALEEQLHRTGCRTFVFDGDNVRHGLNNDLGFSPEDRQENIRRIGEMCKLFMEAGVIALTAFISPFREDRAMVRRLAGEDSFVEVFCDCSLQTCETRDVKGLYAKARAGAIKEFTGISSPYEAPESPELTIHTDGVPVEVCVKDILEYLKGRAKIGCMSDEGRRGLEEATAVRIGSGE
jgi:adenylylsulfate kinase